MCEINEIITVNDDYTLPILAQFQNGFIAEEKAHTVDFELLQDTNTKQKIAVVAAGKDIYQGTINDNISSTLTNTFIGIRNKKTNKIRLIQVEECLLQNQIYDLSLAKNSLYSNLSQQESIALFYKDLSGKKGVRYYEKSTRTGVNVDVLKDDLDNTIKSIADNIEESNDKFDVKTKQQKLNSVQIFPPYNKFAHEVKDVYNLNDILSKELLDKLDEEARNLLEGKSEIEIKATYLVSVLDKIVESHCPDSPENLDKVKICIYINGLITLLNKKRYLYFVNISPNEYVFQDIKARFTAPNSSSGRVSKYTLDKATCYLLALSFLLSEKFEINLNDIVDEFNTNFTELTKFIKLVGGKQKTEDKNLYQLKVITKDIVMPVLEKRKRKF